MNLIKCETSCSSRCITWASTWEILPHPIWIKVNCLCISAVYIYINWTFNTHTIWWIRHCKSHCYTWACRVHSPFSIWTVAWKCYIRLLWCLSSNIALSPVYWSLKCRSTPKSSYCWIISCVWHFCPHSATCTGCRYFELICHANCINLFASKIAIYRLKCHCTC